jgi:hypothetical protein
MNFPLERLGFVHHMLYPGYIKDEAFHADTVLELAGRDEFGAIDFCLPIDPQERKRAIIGLRSCEKQMTYVNHLFPHKKISMGTADFSEKRIIRNFLELEVEAAAEVGASQFLFTSGTDVLNDHQEAIKRFGEMAGWLCEMLAKYGINGIIEPVDTAVDKKFLLGSTKDSVGFVKSVQMENLSLILDMGHMPLLFEDFEDSCRIAGNLLKRVHLATCLVADQRDPLFGDNHISFFHPLSHLGEKELGDNLQSLRRLGYFETQGKILFEVRPLKSESAESCIASHLAMLEKVCGKLPLGFFDAAPKQENESL